MRVAGEGEPRLFALGTGDVVLSSGPSAPRRAVITLGAGAPQDEPESDAQGEAVDDRGAGGPPRQSECV